MELDISILTATLLVTLNSAFFVFSIYLVPSSRNNYTDKNPRAVAHRIIAVTSACVLFTLLLYFGLCDTNTGPSLVQWVYADLNLSCFWSIAFSLILNTALFLSELFAIYLGYVTKEPLIFDMEQLKNYFIAPALEEYAYRAINLRILFSAGISSFWAVVLAPLTFGVSHFHHLLAARKNKAEFKRQLFVRGFQFTYTYLFGIYAGYVLIATKCLYAPLALHSMCNYLGFPNLQLMWADDEDCPKESRKAIKIAFIVGILLFLALIVPSFSFINYY